MSNFASENQIKWDLRYLRLAREAATWSKDPSTKVGSLMVSPDRRIVIPGYNGFPSDMIDDPSWYEDRDEKYPRVIHAEMNAMDIALRVAGTNGLQGWTCYVWPFLSCDRCFVHLAQAGVYRVVAPKVNAHNEARWGDSVARTRRFAKDMVPPRVLVELDFPTEFEQPEVDA
jgi:dCMP deaminase